MKKFMTIFVSALLGVAANAQMMPDSTVNICAYWELGDKYEYRCSESSYSVEGTDTTDVEHSSEIFTIEVIAKEKDSYKLSLTSKNQNSSDEIENVLNSISAENGGDMPLIISTTEMGDIIRLENAQEYCDMLVKAIDPIMEEVGKVKEMSEEEKQMTKAILVEMFADPRVIESMVMDSFGRMLAFHGSRLKIGETYTVEDVATSIFPGVDMPVKAISEYTIKSEDTDDYSAVCEICTSAEKGGIMDCFKETILQASNVESMSEAERAEFMKQVDMLVAAMDIDYEEVTIIENHLASGWPLNSYYHKIIDVSAEGRQKRKVETRSVEIIIDSEKE